MGISDKPAIEQVKELAGKMEASAFLMVPDYGKELSDLIPALEEEMKLAVEAEREKCAQIIENSPTWNKHKGGSLCHCELCAYVRGNASEIRSLGPTDALKEMLDKRDEVWMVALCDVFGGLFSISDEPGGIARAVKIYAEGALAEARQAGRRDEIDHLLNFLGADAETTDYLEKRRASIEV